ncbi:MAG: hypothetical protein NZL92_10030 [Gloeomargarita sp. SKYG116]|nr:hypothetical protein [Gloeomargarita sp. SKYG116]MCS7227061.1 hypothetical protein [Gloeomargarita sp. SKYB31]MDW8402020.1 hypothetical protein [Gloeomargarita sp. SKYGB_i_bin116]
MASPSARIERIKGGRELSQGHQADDLVWQAYLESKKERQEVYRRLAQS